MAASVRPQRRVVFDFEIDFSNGGGLQGQDFRLDLHDADMRDGGIDDGTLARYLVRDLHLLMVGAVRILRKRIIEEPHKRTGAGSAPSAASET